MTSQTKQKSAYGTWKSPISAELVAAGGGRLAGVIYDGDDLYWLEGRPSEGGRQVIVRQRPDGTIEDVLPSGFNARSLVHEYGGGAYTVSKGIIVFANFSDQRIYKIENGAAPEPITGSGKYCYADFSIDHLRNQVVCVQEDHTEAGKPALNSIVTLPINPKGALGYGEMTVCGCEFFSNPRISPDGRLLLWLSWNHPNMPWDGTDLWYGNLDKNGMVAEPRKIAGGTAESIFQPEWLSSSAICYVSDKTGWWNLYMRDLYSDEAVCLEQSNHDFGTAQWVFGMSTYVAVTEDLIVCTFSDQGLWKLAELHLDHDKAQYELRPIENDFTELSTFASNGKKIAMIAGGPTQFSSVVSMDLQSKKFTVIKSASAAKVPDEAISKPQPISFATANGDTAFAFYYAPVNGEYDSNAGELPPLLVKSHGGPTGCASSILNLSIQYWTSRGYAVVDVNYRGSVGFGREYRRKLNGQWGIADVQDCENAAKYLVEQKKADGNRLTITGGSAGGYTTLCALTFGNTFKAGASHFGVSDLTTLLNEDEHKFESRYCDNLVGPYPAAKDIYFARSPINFADKLSCPIIFFQGLEDKVVPPIQSELMVNVLKEKKLPVAYIAYEGEQHGFRKAENIKRTVEAEFYFYAKVFGFQPADDIAKVEIENL